MKKFILCCVSSSKLDQAFLNHLQSYLSNSAVVVERTEVLSEQGLKALDFYLNIMGDVNEIKKNLLEISNLFQVDLAVIPHDGLRSKKKLIVFDMDSTLIQHEVIDEMAIIHGIGEKVKILTERAMNGELNFDQALKERVKLLKGFKKSSMNDILKNLNLTPGVEILLREVKKRGIKTAVISGGFTYFAESLKDRLGLDYAFANELEFKGEELTGNIFGSIINGEEKARLLKELSKKEQITLNEVVAVGDGANDLLMLAQAGLGIAFHAKEKVKKEANYHLSFGPMSSLLYFLGIPGNHLDETL